MRLVSWALGLVLGAIVGGSALVIGVLAALCLVPAIVWAARERARPAGLGGVLVGAGGGAAALLILANARCAASNVSTPNFVSECVGPDLTPYLLVAGILALLGVAVSLVAVARTAPRVA